MTVYDFLCLFPIFSFKFCKLNCNFNFFFFTRSLNFHPSVSYTIIIISLWKKRKKVSEYHKKQLYVCVYMCDLMSILTILLCVSKCFVVLNITQKKYHSETPSWVFSDILAIKMCSQKKVKKANTKKMEIPKIVSKWWAWNVFFIQRQLTR